MARKPSTFHGSFMVHEDDGLNEVGLLALLGLLFETDPAIENGLNLRGKSDLLLLDEGLILKTSSLLKVDLDV